MAPHALRVVGQTFVVTLRVWELCQTLTSSARFSNGDELSQRRVVVMSRTSGPASDSRN